MISSNFAPSPPTPRASCRVVRPNRYLSVARHKEKENIQYSLIEGSFFASNSSSYRAQVRCVLKVIRELHSSKPGEPWKLSKTGRADFLLAQFVLTWIDKEEGQICVICIFPCLLKNLRLHLRHKYCTSSEQKFPEHSSANTGMSSMENLRARVWY